MLRRVGQEVRIAGSESCCGFRTSPLTHILASWKNLGTNCDVEAVLQCARLSYNTNYFKLDLYLNEHVTVDSWVAGTWLCPRDSVDGGVRERPDTVTPRLAQGDEIGFDIAGLLRQARIRIKVRFFVSVCESHLCWSVFHQTLLQCTRTWKAGGLRRLRFRRDEAMDGEEIMILWVPRLSLEPSRVAGTYSVQKLVLPLRGVERSSAFIF